MRPLAPWFWRSHPLYHRTGSEIFAALFGHYLHQPATVETLTVLLESPYPLPETARPHAQNARYSICAGPPRQDNHRPCLWTPGVGEVLPTLAMGVGQVPPWGQAPPWDKGIPHPPENLPFQGGWLGWLGYDLAWEIEQLPYLNPDPLPFPVALWYEPANFAVLDHQEQCLWLAATDPVDLDVLETALIKTVWAAQPFPWMPPQTPLGAEGDRAPLRFQMDQATYESAILQAQKYIHAGDIFQANLSLRFQTQTAEHSWNLYRHLQTINPSPFACYWRTPWGSVMSCSPERLVQLWSDRVQTRPIAGTRPRGQDPAAEQQYVATLLSDPKERAEHIMLVDLERNDLGRVCTWGTVQVNELLTLEYYSHVMHLVSNVVGSLSPGKTAVDVIRALFPGGTITGCPKVRCMEIIEALEPVRRSLFYGSCGYLDWRGNLDLNILIRTLLMGPAAEGGEQPVWGQVGAGIVADSQPEREWFESLQKARAQLLALGLA